MGRGGGDVGEVGEVARVIVERGRGSEAGAGLTRRG